GWLEQEGTPTDVYERPQTRFVADFIGLTNFITGIVDESYRGSSGNAHEVVVSTALGDTNCAGTQPAVRTGERVTLTLRPERVQIIAPGASVQPGWNAITGVVVQATFLGAQYEYRVRAGDGQEVTVRQQNMGVLT